MKTNIIAALAIALNSCAGINATLSTRFGDISTHGETVCVTPRLPATIRISPEK